jgi:hypothetical protein
MARPNGPIRIFLDDERKAPKGWTLVKTIDAFIAAVDAADPTRLEALSLDWHLGRDVPNGNVALDRLIERMRSDSDHFPVLERVHFHSADPDEAVAMARRFAGFIRETIEIWKTHDEMVMMDASMPWDEKD